MKNVCYFSVKYDLLSCWPNYSMFIVFMIRYMDGVQSTNYKKRILGIKSCKWYFLDLVQLFMWIKLESFFSILSTVTACSHPSSYKIWTVLHKFNWRIFHVINILKRFKCFTPHVINILQQQYYCLHNAVNYSTVAPSNSHCQFEPWWEVYIKLLK